MKDLEEIYTNLNIVLLQERKKNSEIIDEELKSRPWFFYFSKIGILEFLANGAPDKTCELYASNKITDLLKEHTNSQLKTIKEYSELNIKIHKEASIELLTFKAIKVLAIIGSVLLFLISIGKLKYFTEFFKKFYQNYLAEYQDFINVLYIPLVLLILTIILFFISMTARVHYLNEAILLDNTIAKAILNINFKKEKNDKMPQEN